MSVQKNFSLKHGFILLVSITMATCFFSCEKNNDVTPSPPAPVDSGTINDVLYIITDIGKLAALDAATGAERWSFLLDPNSNVNSTGVFSSLAYKDGTLYIGSSDYNVYAIDAKTGTKKMDVFNRRSYWGSHRRRSPDLLPLRH